MTSPMQPNAPWADRILRTTIDNLSRKVPQDLLPKASVHDRFGKPKGFDEYGCGHYGCAYPTAKPGVVCKLTTDPTEAFFVAAAKQIGEWPDGIVRYFDMYAIPSESHRNRPVYVLWREEASGIGGLLSYSEYFRLSQAADPYWARPARAFGYNLRNFKEWAAKARSLLRTAKDPKRRLEEAARWQDWAFQNVGGEMTVAQQVGARGGQALAIALRQCEVIAEEMSSSDLSDQVGETFLFYMQHGLLLADVHQNNVGLVEREEYGGPIWAITDPGHAVSIRAEPWNVTIPEL